MSKYRYDNYKIVEANGRYGLASTKGIILEPIYASLVIVNKDKPLPTHKLKKFEDDPYIDSVGELNCQIVIADGKQGLIDSGKLVSELKYERIIKLTFCDYLCMEQEFWSLFHSFGGLTLLATNSMPSELTLKSLLQLLAKNHSQAFSHLSKTLHKTSTSDEYISEYRRYGGIELIDLRSSDVHYFLDSTERVVIHDDFRITYLDTITP
ncbi:MAG: hypothetical protein HY865_24240 [Chloroflexi bacterium]|nr:hypothetical protein [Chloroflexota bacterium]